MCGHVILLRLHVIVIVCPRDIFAFECNSYCKAM